MDMINILEKKYDILKMSLKFKDDENYQQLLSDYKDVSLKLEKNIEDEYQLILAKHTYPTDDLENEKKRLEDLIASDEQIINKQNRLVNEYFEITGSELENVIPISEDFDSEKRLEAINSYYDNNEKIKGLEEEKKHYQEMIKDCTNKKDGYGDTNKKLELELKDSFDDVINLNNCFEGIDVEDIGFELEKLSYNIEESKSNLDNFYLAYQTLDTGNIPTEKRKEYQGYVFEARKEYYKSKQTELLLKIFELVNKIELDYLKLFQKREKIELLLEERLILRKQLQIVSSDFVKEFYEKAKQQFSIIKKEQIVMDNLLSYETKIKSINSEILSLRHNNETVDILSILNEYKIIDTYESDEEQLDISSREQELVNILPNEVTQIRDANINNFENIYNNALDVMKKVGAQFLEHKKEEKKEETNILKEIELPKEDIFEEVKEDNFFEEMNNNDEDKSNDIFLDITTKTINNSNKDINEKDNNIVIGGNDDEFFSPLEKKDLINNYEIKNKKLSMDDEIVNVGLEFPNVDSIGSVKPLSNVNEIESQVNELNGINIPTNGFINNINNNLSINGNDYLNVERKDD